MNKYFPDIEPIAFDIETTPDNNIFSYCLGYLSGKVEVRRIDERVPPWERENNLRKLKSFFQNTTKAKVCHHLHFELKHTPKLVEIPEDTIFHDTMLMSQILKNNTHSHALDYLAYHLADYPVHQDKEIERLNKLYRNYQKIPKEYMDPYQVADGERTILLYRFFWPLIQKEGLVEDYWTEIELVKTTVRKERVGLRLHDKTPDIMTKKIEDDINQLQIDIYNRFGRFINLGSEKQLSRLLYKELGYKPLAYSEKTGDPRTDKDVLQQFREAYPDEVIFDWILRQRSQVKAISTIRQYKQFAKNGILYPNIGTNEASTGRQTSYRPNLHNTSKNTSLRNPYHVALRGCFRCHDHSILYLPDYQGIEMRLIVGIAEDEIMLDLLQRDLDVHQEFMECVHLFQGENYIRLLKESDPKLFKEYRDVDKNGHFATGYGASPLKVAKTCLINIKNFKIGFDKYKLRHPKIVNLLREKMREVREVGYVQTPFGRKIYLNQEDAHAGLNALIQCTAALILKRAEIRVDKMLREKYNDEVKLIHSVHDELFITYPRSYLSMKKEFFNDVTSIMVNIPEIKVKLGTEWKSTKTTWDKTKPEEFTYVAR